MDKGPHTTLGSSETVFSWLYLSVGNLSCEKYSIYVALSEGYRHCCSHECSIRPDTAIQSGLMEHPGAQVGGVMETRSGLKFRATSRYSNLFPMNAPMKEENSVGFPHQFPQSRFGYGTGTASPPGSPHFGEVPLVNLLCTYFVMIHCVSSN